MNRTFKHPIQIVEADYESDSVGNRITKETVFHACRANVNGIGGKEYFAAAKAIEEGEATFEVRFCRKLSGLSAKRHCILFRGERYDITYIDNYQFGNDTLKIRAVMKKGERRGS